MMNKKTKIGVIVAAPLLMFTGCVGGVAIGSDSDDLAAASEPQPTATVTAEPEPAPTVTETAEPEPAPTVTETAEPEVVTETEEVTPDACITATDDGVALTRIYSDTLKLSADAMDAAVTLDVARIDQATADMDALLVNELEPTLDSYFLNAFLCNPDLAEY